MASRTCPTLLERLRDASDPVAWDDFFRSYWPVVYAYSRDRGCSEHTAEEIVQEVMLTVFAQRDVFHYDPSRGRFRDWLYRVTRNQVAQRRRRPSERVRAFGGEASESPLEVESPEETPDAVWEKAFEQALLAALLDTVRRETPPEEFMAFELTVLQEQSPAVAAQLTGITRNMVYKARRKVLARLRELAGDYASEGELCHQVRLAMAAHPAGSAERSLTRQIANSIRQGAADA
jgi:RNA polymerase sigma-70 factor (ECF subfamily)